MIEYFRVLVHDFDLIINCCEMNFVSYKKMYLICMLIFNLF